MTFLEEAAARGLIQQESAKSGLIQHLQQPRTVYLGFDATASSLHVGHLMPISLARLFARHGHQVVLLLGEGTTLVGDPTGRTSGRPMLSPEIIQSNAHSLTMSLTRLFEDREGVMQLSNAAWLQEVGLLTFLRDVGSKVTVARMLSMDSVKARLGDGLTFMEMSYMLLQAYDFLELAQRHDVSIQIGGQDQWGNILAGVDLVHRDGLPAFAMTTPLLTRADGTKMGKTADGAVWLKSALTSPFSLWQFWRNVDDSDVVRFLLALTDLSVGYCNSFGKLQGTDLNEAKRVLATSVVEIVHGRVAAEGAKAAADGLNTLPVIVVEHGQTIAETLVRLSFASSLSEGRRLISGSAVRLDGQKVSDPKALVDTEDFSQGLLRIDVGRSKAAMLQMKV